MNQIKDIWFRSELRLEAIASRLGLKNVDYDVENYWEWVIGTFNGLKLDITRCHLIDPLETETRIFVVGGGIMDDSTVDSLVSTIKPFSASPVSAGQWLYVGGNNYKYIEIRKFT